MYRNEQQPVKVAAMAWALCATIFVMGSLAPIGFDGRPFSGVGADAPPARLAGYLA